MKFFEFILFYFFCQDGRKMIKTKFINVSNENDNLNLKQYYGFFGNLFWYKL